MSETLITAMAIIVAAAISQVGTVPSLVEWWRSERSKRQNIKPAVASPRMARMQMASRYTGVLVMCLMLAVNLFWLWDFCQASSAVSRSDIVRIAISAAVTIFLAVSLILIAIIAIAPRIK